MGIYTMGSMLYHFYMSDKEDEDKLVRVADAPNPIIAASWQGLLDAEGIPSMIRVDDPLGVAYHVSSFYPCGLFVLARYAERAKQLLEGLSDEGGEGTLEHPETN
jgi:hypothetical protein